MARKKHVRILSERRPDVDQIDALDYASDSDFSDGSKSGSLCEKLADRAQEQRSRDTASEVGADPQVEHICPSCHRLFYTALSEKHVSCPRCGVKFAIEDADEVHLTREREASAPVQERLTDKAKARSVRNGFLFNDAKDRWTNESKGQISLEQGSDEYEEYVEDIKEQLPSKPSDEFHEELSEHNADLVTRLYDKASENPEAPDDRQEMREDRLKAQSAAMKRALHGNAVRAAIAAARNTEGLSDDQLAMAITTDNPILYDPSIPLGKYDDAVVDYVLNAGKH